MKKLIICIAGVILISCGKSDEKISESTAPKKWLVMGEIEPRDQFVLTAGQTTGLHNGDMTGPGPGLQDYRVYVIDTRSFESGTLIVDLQMSPEGECAASMDLFDAEARLPADPKGQEDVRLSAHRLHSEYGSQGIKPGERATLEYSFDKGQIFQLGVTGDWFSPPGAQSDFVLEARVEAPQ